MSINKQFRLKGFSLFEFVIAMVIMILVVLVIVPAIEKTIQFAHEYSVQATAKAFQKSIEIGHQLYNLSGEKGPVTNLERYNEGDVDFNEQGYPIGAVLSESGDEPSSDYACIDVWNAVLSEARPMASIDKKGQYQAKYQYFNRQGRCHFYYLSAGKMSITYEFRTGKVYYDKDFF